MERKRLPLDRLQIGIPAIDPQWVAKAIQAGKKPCAECKS